MHSYQHLIKVFFSGLMLLSFFTPNGFAESKADSKAEPSASAPKKAPKKAPPKTKSSVQVSGLMQSAIGWTSPKDETLDARPLLGVYRARFWVRGSVNKKASYALHFAFDRAGIDQEALLMGKSLNDLRAPALQDAILHYHILPKQKLILSSGFLRPKVGHENNSVVITMPNLEPTFSSTLVRRATTDTGHGRSSGFNLGHLSTFGAYHLQAHAGVFMPPALGTSNKTSQGEKMSPLMAGTLSLGWGSLNKMRNQNLLFVFNPLKKARSIEVGASFAQHGETNRLKYSRVFSTHLMAQLDHLLFDAEWVQAYRESLAGEGLDNFAWHVRAAYNVKLGKRQLTPFVIYSELKGSELSQSEFEDADLSSLNLFAGKRQLTDVGLHYHLNKRKLRLGLHGIYSTGSDDDLTRLPARTGWTGLLTLHMHI